MAEGFLEMSADERERSHLVRQHVEIAVHHFTDGRLRVSYKDRVLTCTAYGSYAVPDPAEDEKTLDARVDAIVAARGQSGRGITVLAA
jgi:hypothetical protein